MGTSQGDIITMTQYNEWISRLKAIYKNHNNGLETTSISFVNQGDFMTLDQINKVLRYYITFADGSYGYLSSKLTSKAIINSNLISTINSKLDEWELKEAIFHNTFSWITHMDSRMISISTNQNANTCDMHYTNDGGGAKFLIECYTRELNNFEFRFSVGDEYGGRASLTAPIYIHFIDGMYEAVHTISLSNNDYVWFDSDSVDNLPTIYGFTVNNDPSSGSTRWDLAVDNLPAYTNLEFSFKEKTLKWNDSSQYFQKLMIINDETYH